MRKIILENNELYIEVVPFCGGKVYTLISKMSGRQWLWRNPRLSLRIPHYGDSYVRELDSGGWDEVFPSVEPCRIPLSGHRELVVPDHGDIVALPVSVEQPDSQTLITVTRGRSANFEFIRKIVLQGHSIEMTYRVRNADDYVFPFLWCAHPLIHFEKGMKIDLECSIPFRVESVFGAAPFRVGDSFRWAGSNGPKKMPCPGDDDFKPFAMKVFSEADNVQAVTIISADGQETLKFAWESPLIRHLGIWMNYGAWCGIGRMDSYCLGVEPTTSAFDDLGKAVAKNRAILLEPGESRQWSMEIAIGQLRKDNDDLSRPQAERLQKQ